MNCVHPHFRKYYPANNLQLKKGEGFHLKKSRSRHRLYRFIKSQEFDCNNI